MIQAFIEIYRKSRGEKMIDTGLGITLMNPPMVSTIHLLFFWSVSKLSNAI